MTSPDGKPQDVGRNRHFSRLLARASAWRFIAIALGALQVWAYRYDANPDGVSYLDVADTYREGRWTEAPNGYWSPMYSWLLAVALALLRPTTEWEFVIAHVVNFAAFVAAIVAFEFLTRGIWRNSNSPEKGQAIEGAWITLAYCVFIWTVIGLIGLGRLTPDILLAAEIFCIAGFLARLRTRFSWPAAAILGVTCGLAFLTKSVFLPLTIVVFVVGALLARPSRRAAHFVGIAATSFIVVAAPYVVALSHQKGRVTFGETGRLAHAWVINGVPGGVHWQGQPGEARHPTRLIATAPDVYEFGTPLIATYPPWYDPSYWYEGVGASFAPGTQIRVVLGHIPELLQLLTPLLLVLLAAILAHERPRTAIGRVSRESWWLAIPALAAITIYAAILVETRYVGAFIALLWLAAFVGIRELVSSQWFRALSLASAVLLVLATVPTLAPFPRALLPRHANIHWQRATDVARAGVGPEEKIAFVGDAIYEYWPRLARVKIVAEIPAREASTFWTAAPAERARIAALLTHHGVHAVVAKNPPGFLSRERWQFTPDSTYAVLRLEPL